MVHLMSRGALVRPERRQGREVADVRIRFADGGELQLTEAGSKKRAGVGCSRPEAVEAELAHLGPEADSLSTEDVARILASDSRRLPPGCFRSAKPNVVDLILPPVLARYRVTNWEVACLGTRGWLG